ncbi:MAG: DUF4835 family protein [Melioribacteraceae bacterium]|nr:DUF4835 family protein [Melioribacteraceae bacterium]
MKKIILAILLLPIFITAQELEATVNVNYESLPSDYRDKLHNFASIIEEYVNTNRFTDGSWEYEKIKCSFNIFFTSSSNQTNYSAQVVITSQRPIENTKNKILMLKIMDNSWSFNYEQGQSLFFDFSEFDPLTSFLDFYALVILGFDFDSWEPLGGNDFFNLADNISSQGANSSYSSGWQLERAQYNKRGLLMDLRNAKFQQFREDFCNYHVNGVDIFNHNPAAAHKVIVKLIDNLYENRDNIDSRSVLMRLFFNSKSNEIADYLVDYEDLEIFDKLKAIDPAHIAKYNEILDSK